MNPRFYSILFFLALLVFANSAKVSIVYGYYYIDSESFIKNLCVNIDKPKLQCKGKCYLEKVSQTSTDNETIPEPNTDLKKVILFLTPSLFNIDELFSTRLKQDYTYEDLYAFVVLNTVFHPPKIKLT